MSAGKVHTRASLILASGFVAGAVITHNYDPQYAIGALVGIMASPDLDVDSGFIGHSYIGEIPFIGKPLLVLWKALWYTYSTSIQHGSAFSHFPVIGTLGRIGYIYSTVIFFPHIIASILFTPEWDLWYVLGWYAMKIALGYKIVLGMVCADIVHWALDVGTTEHKKKGKRHAGVDMPNMPRDIRKT